MPKLFYCQPERAPEKGYILLYYAIIFFDAGERKVGGLVFHNIFFPNVPNFVLTSFCSVLLSWFLSFSGTGCDVTTINVAYAVDLTLQICGTRL